MTHLSKQLKSRAYAAAAEAAEDGVLGAEGVLENGIANERDDEVRSEFDENNHRREREQEKKYFPFSANHEPILRQMFPLLCCF